MYSGAYLRCFPSSPLYCVNIYRFLAVRICMVLLSCYFKDLKIRNIGRTLYVILIFSQTKRNLRRNWPWNRDFAPNIFCKMIIHTIDNSSLVMMNWKSESRISRRYSARTAFCYISSSSSDLHYYSLFSRRITKV
jgi:hypothetical protein